MSAKSEQPLTLVDVFAPWAGIEERALRLRLQKAQTIALAKVARERNARARLLYRSAASLASAWLFRRVDDLETLVRMLRALNQIFMAADSIVQVEGADVE